MAKQSAAPAFPFAPDEIVVCLESFAGYPEIVVKAGARLRADHEAVQRYPGMFAKDGLSDQEMARLLEERRPPREIAQHVPITREEEPLTDENSVLCIRNIRGTLDGDTHLARPLAVAIGMKLAKTEPIVKANPDCFIAIVPEGLTRQNAVRALTDNFVYQRDENGAFIEETDGQARLTYGNFKRFILWRAGQWVSREHPDVKQHPERFEVLAG